jgi:hypothetical protein
VYTLTKQASLNQATPAVCLVNIYNLQEPDVVTHRQPCLSAAVLGGQHRGAGLQKGLVRHRDKGRAALLSAELCDERSDLERRGCT